VRLAGGLLYLGGMLIMAWNVVMTARSSTFEPVRIPQLNQTTVHA
jgi:cytochrome c oxidase cbb3-type subunit 1